MTRPLQRFCTRLFFIAFALAPHSFATAQGTKIPSADEVKASKARYEAERAEIEKAGIAKRFPPLLLDKAAAMAKKGDSALAAGRLLQASEAYRQARWQLPYQPGHVPENVTRIIGNLRLRHGGGISALAFSPDGQRLATGSADTTVKVWDLGNGHEICRFTGHADFVRFVFFTPDGKTCISAGAERDIKLWDAATGKQTAVITGALARVTAMTLSKDGKYLIVGHANDPGKQPPNQLCVYEVAGGKRIRATDFPATISSLNFNATGTLVAAADERGAAHLWDYPAIADAPNKPAYWTQEDTTGAAYHVAFSPDGQTLLRCGLVDIKFYHVVQPGAAFQVVPPKSTISLKVPQHCSAYSYDGKVLFTGGVDGIIRAWDTENNYQPLNLLKGHGGPITALVFNPGGNQLASASTDYAVRLWDFDIVLQSRDFAGHEGPVWTAFLSPDGQMLATASGDRTLRIWDAISGKVLHTITDHNAPVTFAVFSPDGATVASAGGDRMVRLFDARSGKPIRMFEGHASTITSIDFSADGKRLVSAGADKTIRIWDVATGKASVLIDSLPSIISSVAFHPEGKQIAAGFVDQSIRLFDDAGKPMAQWPAHGNAVACVAYSPDGLQLASSGFDMLVNVWPLATPGQNPIRLAGHTGAVSSVAFRSGGLLASAGGDQLVKLWKIEGTVGKEVQTFRGHKDWVSNVAFSKDGAYLISCGLDRLVKLWEITTRDVPILAEHTSSVESVAYSPDGKYLVTGGADHFLKIWDRATGTEAASFQAHSGGVLAALFRPDSKSIVSSGGEQSLKQWGVTPARELEWSPQLKKMFTKLRAPSPYLALDPTGKRLYAWQPLRDARSSTLVECFDLDKGEFVFEFTEADPMRIVFSMSFCANGKIAATGAKNGSVRFWSLEGADEGRKPLGPDWFLFKTAVGDLGLSADGSTLVATSDDGEIKICDVAKREIKLSIKGHSAGVVACQISPDGKRCATASKDNTIKLWDLATGKELRKWDLSGAGTAKEMLVRNLAFSPDSRQLASANINSTVYLLELP